MVAQPHISLDDPALYINRELSWIQFNQRVLDEAHDPGLPLLERVRFLSIYANNLDEFFMIRVSGLRRQLAAGAIETPADGMRPAQELLAIRDVLTQQLTQATELWLSQLQPALQGEAINILPYNDLKPGQLALLRQFFSEEVFPVLTPLAFDPAHPFPHISNLSLNLAVVVRDAEHGERFARVKVADVFPRLIRVPDEDEAGNFQALGLGQVMANNFVWLEDIIAANLDMLFPGLEVVASYAFRITRDADLEINDDEAADLLVNIEEHVELRNWGSVVRLEVDKRTPELLRENLGRNLEISAYQVYQIEGPLGLASLMELTRVDRPDLKYPLFIPAVPAALERSESIFDVVKRGDLLLYHPYDSFMPIVDFLQQAAQDPDVMAIKQTLYRVGTNSPIVDALMLARQNGKQVAVLLELKARFDEENNIAWARALEDEGVHVVYGVMGLKTHAKMCLVVRREAGGIKRYVHLGTGNYNPVTARIYTDLSLFTADPIIGSDVSDLFNALTGYSGKDRYRKLLVAPGLMRHEVLSRIEREIQRHKEHGDGYIAFKMNALVDRESIKALYRASQAGVRIDLQVRGICCLRPGLPGISETINVTSIVGRFLEHARIYYFRNGSDEELFLGSADLMPRNLDRRVEVLFPIKERRQRDIIVEDILKLHLSDTAQLRRLSADGSYQRVSGQTNAPIIHSQSLLLENWREGRIRDNS